MNQYNDYVQYAYEDDDLEIDLKDMLAGMFLRWKTILLCMILVGAAACGIAFWRGTGEKLISDENISDARATIAVDKAEDAEQLFSQYNYYMQYRRQMLNDNANVFSINHSIKDVVVLNAQYFVDSAIVNLDRFFSTLVLDESDYDRLREIAPDEEAFASVYQRIVLSVNRNDYNNNYNNIMVNESLGAGKYLFSVAVYGNNKDQCEAMLRVVQEALEREIDALRVADPEIQFSFLSKQFSNDVNEYFQTQQRINNARINQIDSQLNNISYNVTKFTSEQKDYYDLLVEQAEQEYQPEKHVSWKKWTVIGAFLGAILAVGGYFLRYLFDGKVKTPAEAETLFHAHTLQRFSHQGKKNLFGKWAAGLSGAELTDPGMKATMLAADLQTLMEKTGHKELYLVCDNTDDKASSTAKDVCQKVAERNGSLHVIVGNPLATVAELEQLAAAEDVVVFTELRHSSRKTVTRWQEMCTRHGIPVLGCVAVETCW